MKLKALMSLNHKGKSYDVGDEIKVDEDKVQVFIDKGWACKEAKSKKKETKELKKESIETKDDASE
jgi:hypothetical protein|tara:strand:+ start:3234 stop:3431 length:198 start_codon:yes stop_codon:yes gene_type:complete